MPTDSPCHVGFYPLRGRPGKCGEEDRRKAWIGANSDTDFIVLDHWRRWSFAFDQANWVGFLPNELASSVVRFSKGLFFRNLFKSETNRAVSCINGSLETNSGPPQFFAENLPRQLAHNAVGDQERVRC